MGEMVFEPERSRGGTTSTGTSELAKTCGVSFARTYGRWKSELPRRILHKPESETVNANKLKEARRIHSSLNSHERFEDNDAHHIHHNSAAPRRFVKDSSN